MKCGDTISLYNSKNGRVVKAKVFYGNNDYIIASPLNSKRFNIIAYDRTVWTSKYIRTLLIEKYTNH